MPLPLRYYGPGPTSEPTAHQLDAVEMPGVAAGRQVAQPRRVARRTINGVEKLRVSLGSGR
jgi:hypothetical protein